MTSEEKDTNNIVLKISNSLSVLDISLKDMKELIEAKFVENKEAHDSIIKRQDKTNGNVSSLKLWRAVITGGMSVLLFFIGLFGYFIKDGLDTLMHIEKTKAEISASVLSEIEQKYEIEITSMK